MSKGIIMSISDREAVILTKDSNFVKIMLPEGEYDVGQEINTGSTGSSLMRRWALPAGRRWAAVAAVLLIAIMIPVVTNIVSFNSTVYAYVTLDINPSAEFTINGRDRILAVQPLNEEGAIILEGTKLAGKNIEYGIEYFLAKACQLGYSADGGAVIATTIMEGEESAALEQKILAALDRTIEENELPVKAGVLSATKQIKEEAGKAGISAGKYLIALQASDDQLDVDMEEVKNSSIGTAIKKAGGNLESILKKARKNNEELTRLLEDNRDKLKNKDNGNNGNSNNSNISRDNNGNSSRDNNGNSSRDNNGNSSRDNNGNSSRDNNGNSSRDNNGNSSRDNNGNSSRDNNGNSSRDNNGNSSRDNNGNSSRDNNGNSSRDNNGNSSRDNNGNSGKDNNGNSSRDNRSYNRDNKGNARGRPGVIEDIIMQLFD